MTKRKTPVVTKPKILTAQELISEIAALQQKVKRTLDIKTSDLDEIETEVDILKDIQDSLDYVTDQLSQL